ncbi:MAG TPA: YkgJ family cysteine cluster protein [Cyclobacteriaceae bacterium]|nr:YkgJ family cysteine cluster protein [Cyclobacteriaceae bacterium]
MTPDEKVKEVEAVFQKLDAEIAQFQSLTGMHCKFGCGKCCFKPDIEATALEFLPFAVHLYREGLAEQWYERLTTENSADTLCLILNPTQAAAGLCTEYKHRGLICRLFGYSARTNKYEKKELVTCQVIKTEESEEYRKGVELVDSGGQIPVMSQYYMQLHAIDADLATEFYPINVAIRKALENVMHYYAYR